MNKIFNEWSTSFHIKRSLNPWPSQVFLRHVDRADGVPRSYEENRERWPWTLRTYIEIIEKLWNCCDNIMITTTKIFNGMNTLAVYLPWDILQCVFLCLVPYRSNIWHVWYAHPEQWFPSQKGSRFYYMLGWYNSSFTGDDGHVWLEMVADGPLPRIDVASFDCQLSHLGTIMFLLLGCLWRRMFSPTLWNARRREACTSHFHAFSILWCQPLQTHNRQQ